MADRCFVCIVIKEEDREQVERELGEAEHEEYNYEKGGGLLLQIPEVNYAGYNELTELAQRGLSFYGWHDEGDDYPAGLFVGHGKGYRETLKEKDSYCPLARISEGGFPEPEDIKGIKEYFALLTLAKGAIRRSAQEPLPTTLMFRLLKKDLPTLDRTFKQLPIPDWDEEEEISRGVMQVCCFGVTCSLVKVRNTLAEEKVPFCGYFRVALDTRLPVDEISPSGVAFASLDGRHRTVDLLWGNPGVSLDDYGNSKGDSLGAVMEYRAIKKALLQKFEDVSRPEEKS